MPNYLRAAPIRRASDYQRQEFKPNVTPVPVPASLQHVTTPVPRPGETSHKPITKRSGLGSKVLTAFVIIICSALGFLASDLVLGQIAIVIYGVAAIAFRIKSQTTFILALIALVCVPLLIVLGRTDGLAENFAVYAFLLLLIGVISAAIELRREDKHRAQAHRMR